MNLNIKYRFISFIGLLILSLTAMAQKVITNYTLANFRTTLQLEWKTDNYGSIQWQKSTDDGTTWTDIDGATSKSYYFTALSEAYYRVVVNGDEACEPFTETHIVKPVTFTVTNSSIGFNSASYKITDINIPAEDIVEYGFCYNYSGVNRTYANTYMEPVGTTVSNTDELNAVCPNLLPGRTYVMYFYLKTKDGAVIKRKLSNITTKAGLEWVTENWTTSQRIVSAKFKISGYSGTAPDVTFQLGTEGNMTTYTATADENYIYTSTNIRTLAPGTEYKAKVTATINGEEQTIEKTVRTWTDYSTYTVDNTVKAVSHKIVWNNTRTQLNPDNIQAEYPRFLRVNSDTILLVYHGGNGTTAGLDHWQNIYLQRSTDNGKTWSDPETIMSKSMTWTSNNSWYRFADPELTKLENGWILLQFVGNANPETNDNCQVIVMLSRDGGSTWGDPITVGRGRTWEPKLVQLPKGELELLVSSEADWWQTSSDVYQRILCARSTDNGQTWTKFRTACYNPGKRDGMPVPVLLQGNKGINFIIESVNDPAHSPSIIHRDLNGEWNSDDWNGISDDTRWTTGKISDGGAPYMIQLPTGETVVCSHVKTDTNGDVWQTGRSRIIIGDNTGHNFTNLTAPFTNLPRGEGAYYCSLFQKDENTIWLAISHSVYDGTTCTKNTVEYIEGKIVAQ